MTMQPQNSENNKEDSSSQIVSEQVYGFETQNKFQSSVSNNPPSIEPPLQKKKRNKWKYYFIFLAIANIVTIIIPLLLVYTVPLLALVYMLAFGSWGAIGVGVAILNIITISTYLFKKHPRRGAAIFGGIIVILSAFYVSIYALSVYSSTKQINEYNTPLTKNEALSLINSCQVTKIYRKDQLILFTKHDPNSSNPSDYQRYANDSDFNNLKEAATTASAKCGTIDVVDIFAINSEKPVDITVAQATDLLNSCKLIGFYYDEQTSDPSNQFNAEHSSTGIVLGYENDPLHIHIANRMVATMVPIARAAQQKCPNLQFWHDGKYE